MKTAYTGWMWLRECEGHPQQFQRQFEQCVMELTYLGYDYLENFTFLKDYLTPAQVRDVCTRYGASFSALYTNLEEDLDSLKRDADFVAEIGGKWLVCSSPNWPDDTGLDAPWEPEEIRREAEICNKLGEYASTLGIKLLHNHHSYTPVCRRNEIDELMRLTSPEWVGLCVDNGHALVTGLNMTALIRDYGDRIDYAHIKDLDPALSHRGRGMSWVPLGLGTAHLSAFLSDLKQAGFDGIVCAGLPLGCEKINRFESARISRLYLRSAFSL